MKSARALKELAEKHDVALTHRVFLEVRDEESRESTTFLDLPRPKDDIIEDLRNLGVLPSG